MLQEGEMDHGGSNDRCIQGEMQAELQAGSLNLKKATLPRDYRFQFIPLAAGTGFLSFKWIILIYF